MNLASAARIILSATLMLAMRPLSTSHIMATVSSPNREGEKQQKPTNLLRQRGLSSNTVTVCEATNKNHPARFTATTVSSEIAELMLRKPNYFSPGDEIRRSHSSFDEYIVFDDNCKWEVVSVTSAPTSTPTSGPTGSPTSTPTQSPTSTPTATYCSTCVEDYCLGSIITNNDGGYTTEYDLVGRDEELCKTCVDTCGLCKNHENDNCSNCGDDTEKKACETMCFIETPVCNNIQWDLVNSCTYTYDVIGEMCLSSSSAGCSLDADLDNCWDMAYDNAPYILRSLYVQVY